MSRDKKWSSNDKNQLLVENFRKFMEKGDFSADEELSERSWAQMGKDIMKGDFTGNKRQANNKKFALEYLGYVEDNLWRGSVEAAIANVVDNDEGQLQKQLELTNSESLEDLLLKYAYTEYEDLRYGHDDKQRSDKKQRDREERQKQNRWDAEAEDNRRRRPLSDRWPSSSKDSNKRKSYGHHSDGAGYGRQHSAPWDE